MTGPVPAVPGARVPGARCPVPGARVPGARELKSANVSAFALIASSKVRVHQLLRSWRAQKCELISFFVHRELKRANVSAVLFLESSKNE